MNDTPAEIDRTEPPIDVRPAHACVTCPPPKTNAWWPAHPGFKTCDDCYDSMRDTLQEIAQRYHILDPSPGGTGEPGGRGAPGFGSRPAAVPHVITMRDFRSKPCEVSIDAVLYVWDPLADTILEPGQYGPPSGAYVEKREVWLGRDGRGHAEQERPPRSIPGTLSGLATMIAEERDMTAPTTRQVPELVRWLDAQMDWITRNDLVEDLWEEFRALAAQLRPVTGVPGKRCIGLCPNVIDDDNGPRRCRARLYAPTTGDTITCATCEKRWPREEWVALGASSQKAS